MKNILGTETKNGNGLEIEDKAIQQLFKDRCKDIKRSIIRYGLFAGYETQNDIAAAVNVSREFLNGVLNGRRKCPVDLLRALSEKLQFDIADLINLRLGLENEEIQSHDDLLHAYLLSFGVSINNHGDLILEDQLMPNKRRYKILPKVEYEKLLQQIDAVTRTLIETAFLNFAYNSSKRNEMIMPQDKESD